MLSERPMDWTHRLFNRARSSRSQTLTDNQTVRLSLQVLSYVLHLRAHPLCPETRVGQHLRWSLNIPSLIRNVNAT